SVMLAIGSGSFLYLKKPGGSPDAPMTAHANEPSLADVLPREAAPQSMPPAAPVPPARNVAELDPPAPTPALPDRIDEIPPPRAKGADVLVAPPLRPIPPLERFIVRV